MQAYLIKSPYVRGLPVNFFSSRGVTDFHPYMLGVKYMGNYINTTFFSIKIVIFKLMVHKLRPKLKQTNSLV